MHYSYSRATHEVYKEVVTWCQVVLPAWYTVSQEAIASCSKALCKPPTHTSRRHVHL